MPCHDLCLNGCFGPKKTECYDCKSAKMKKYIPKMENLGSEHWILECLDGFDCPAGYYFANQTSFCEECSNRCNPKLGTFFINFWKSIYLNLGCTGPGDFIGENGCNACSSVIIPRDYKGTNTTENDTTDLGSGLQCRLSSQVRFL